MPEIDPELISLAHACFQQHVPDAMAPQLCACLRAHPCPLRSWAVGYLVQAGRLVLPPPTGRQLAVNDPSMFGD